MNPYFIKTKNVCLYCKVLNFLFQLKKENVLHVVDVVLLERAITPQALFSFQQHLCFWRKYRQKKVNYPLKGQLTKRERQPQEPYVVPAGMTQEVKA